MAPDGWSGGMSGSGLAVEFSPNALVQAAARFRERVNVFRDEVAGGVGVSFGDEVAPPAVSRRLVASLPPVYPEWLGSAEFLATHRVRFPYVAGAMAHGIACRRLVVAMARAELLAFFGAAGLSPSEVEANVAAIEQDIGGIGVSWGSDLIHSPHDPALEDELVDLYLRHRVRRVSASAFMR